MKFAHLQMLFMIWLAPAMFVVVLWGVQKRRKILERFSTPKGLSVIAITMSSGRRWIKAGLILTAILLTAVALSGPQYGFRWQEVERKGIDIMIALDCSRSMLAKDVPPTRLDRAKREIIDLLTMLEGDRIGLVAFAGQAFLQCPLTLDYEAFHIFLNGLSPDSISVGGTDMSAAIDIALEGFEKTANTEKAIILITDGESTGGDPLAAAEKAAKDGIKLFCIGVGDTEGAPVPSKTGGFQKGSNGTIVLTRLDEESLKKMAALTGGMYVGSVAGDMDLDVIYHQEIRGKMDVATLTTQRKQIWEDRFQWPLLLALAALISEMFIPAAKRGVLLLLLTGMIVFSGVKPLWAESFSESSQLGQGAYEKGKYDDALKHFIDAQLEKPESPEINYNIGNVYYKKGEYDAALRQYRKVIETKEPALRQKAFYNLGNTSFRMNRIDEAIKDYEAALKIEPQDKQAAQNLEFARKALEQQKKQSKSPSNENQSKTGSGEKEKQPPEKGKEDPQAGKTSEPPSSASPDDRPEKDAEKPSQGADGKSAGQDSEKQGKSQAPEPSGAETESKASAASEKPDGTVDKHQTERILNRLQDLPGGAMTPRYGKTQVEKDW